jgi:ribosomal protein L14
MRGAILYIGDNTEVRRAKCIGIRNVIKSGFQVGSHIIVVIPYRRVSRRLITKNIYSAVIVTTRKEKRRLSGFYVKALFTKALLLKTNVELVGNHIYGPICFEVQQFFSIKMLSYTYLCI